MRTTRLSALACLICLGWVPAVPASEEARALVAAAVAAQGGEANLARRTAWVLKVRGRCILSGEEVGFSGEVCLEPPSRARVTLEAETDGAPVELDQILDGGRGWHAITGRAEDLDPAALAELQQAVYMEHVVTLLPLLHDPSFTLTTLGERKVRGAAARAIRVSSPGRPDVVLSFDPASGLLVKCEYRQPARDGKGAVLRETYYSDYREPDLGAADEATLRAARVAVDGPGLLAFLRRQTPAPADPVQVALLIRRLGDDAYAVREKASADLAALGTAAAPFLRQALHEDDAEIATRAQVCLRRLGDRDSPATVAAALRLAAFRRPEGAAEAVQGFLARTRDEGLAREARAALVALGRDEGDFGRRPGRRVYPTGIKLPMKAMTFVDGKLELEQETQAVEYYNSFDGARFARPAGPGKAQR